MARFRTANTATDLTKSSLLLTNRDFTRTEPPAVVEWNAKRRKLVLRVFNTKTADGLQRDRRDNKEARGPTKLDPTEPYLTSPDNDVQVPTTRLGHPKYQPKFAGPLSPHIDSYNGNSKSAFEANGLAAEESHYKQFEPVRTVGSGGGGFVKRSRVKQSNFDSGIGNTVTNTDGRLEYDSRKNAEVDVEDQHRALVIVTTPNSQSTESETADFYTGTRNSFPHIQGVNWKPSRTTSPSAFLPYSGAVSTKRHPTDTTKIRRNKGPVDRFSSVEHLERSKTVVRDPRFLDSIALDPHELDPNEADTLNYPYRIWVREHRDVRRRRTMNKFPSKRPLTPENLKVLSAKHVLKTLREKDAETGLRRHHETSEVRRQGWSPPETVVEEDLDEEEDYTDTRTTSTNSSSTVYLIRTVKKSNRYGSNDRTKTNKTEPDSNQTAEPHRRNVILDPVTLQGIPADKDRSQRTRTRRTKRVKNSVTQTNEDTSHTDTSLAADIKSLPRLITPRKQKRSIGLQTVIEEELGEQLSGNPDSLSSRIKPKKSTIAVQTEMAKPPKSNKITIGTQTLEQEATPKVTRESSLSRRPKVKHDFCGQTEGSPSAAFNHEISERGRTFEISPLLHNHEAQDVILPTPAIPPRQPHDTLNSGPNEIPPAKETEAKASATNAIAEDQGQLVYGLQHEVRLLRHENYYLRQQLDYPIKPKGRLQKQNEEKILQIIRHLESQGPTGRLTSEIREEMMHEAMIENEILRSENADLQATLDQSRRLQETLSTENEQLRSQFRLQQQQQQQQQQQMSLHGFDDDHRQMAADNHFDHRRTLEADDIDASRSVPTRVFTNHTKDAESDAIATGAQRTQATKHTKIPKLSASVKLKKSEVRK